MSKVAVSNKESLEAVCSVLDTLKVPYEKVSKKKNSYVFYKTPEEVNAERIPVPLELDDVKMLRLMNMAHENNMNFNDFCNKILREEIEKLEKAQPIKKTKKIKKTRKSL